MGPPGADQHLAGSSRAAGRDLTGRGMLTARRPWTEYAYAAECAAVINGS
jgi:hypothetical protein